MRVPRLLALATATVLTSSLLHLACGATADSDPVLATGGDGGPASREDGGTPVGRAPDASLEGASCPPKPAADPSRGVYLVNATTRFGAFRICPPASTTGTASASRMLPAPAAKMPRSNLSGVDVSSAARIAPSSELAGAEVLAIKIDDVAKSNPSIETATCAQLACEGSGAGCLSAANVFRVPVVARPGVVVGTVDRALGRGRTIAVLRDDGALRLEIEELREVEAGCEGDLDVDFHDLSASPPSGDALVYDGPTSRAGSTSLQLPADYTLRSFAYDGHEETLAAVHDHSDPRTAIDAFYRAPGPFLLFFVRDGSGPHFVGLPSVGPAAPIGDAGAD